MVFERRHEADNSLRGSGRDDCDVGVAGCRVVRLHVDAASPAYNLAAVHRSLEDDTRHTKRFKVACSYDPVPLQVPKQSLDVAGGGHNRFRGVLLILCRTIFWQRVRNILVPVWTTVHWRRNLATGRTARFAPRQGSLIRSVAREINGFLKATSLNPTLFQGIPSPLADNRQETHFRDASAKCLALPRLARLRSLGIPATNGVIWVGKVAFRLFPQEDMTVVGVSIMLTSTHI